MVVLFSLDLWEMFFSPILGFEPGTSGYLVLHSNTVPQQLLVFTSNTFRYLTLVQKDWWWYCSDWTCDRFSFTHTRVWTDDLWISSPTTLPLHHDNFRFSLLTFSGIWLWCRGIGGGIILIGPVRDVLSTHTGVWTRDFWISSPAL